MVVETKTLEQALPTIAEQLKAVLKNFNLDVKRFTFQSVNGPIRNGHADRSWISFMDRSSGRCMILVGGMRNGNRPDLLYKDNVPVTEVVRELLPLLTYFKAEGHPEELLGDFCQRTGLESLLRFDAMFQTLVGRVDGGRSRPIGRHARFKNLCDRSALP